MITVNERASHRTTRLHGNALRAAAVAAAAALALMLVAASPAFATSQDGTSNTIQFSAESAVIDQAHHRVLVTAPGVAGLEPGRW